MTSTTVRRAAVVAALLAATAGCKSKGDGGSGGGDRTSTAAPADASTPPPSRGPERAVYSLADNRLAAHLHRGGGVLVVAGSAGFGKYLRFGNAEEAPPAWALRQRQGDVRVATLRGTAGAIDVPLTADEANATVVRLRAYAAEAGPVSLRVNGHPDVNAELPAGWSTTELTVPAGQLREGDNELSWFVRGPGLAVEWIQVGGAPPGDDATRAWDAGAGALVIPAGGAMTWYVFVPEGGRVVADLADPACRVDVTAIGDGGARAAGTLAGAGSAVDLAALAGTPVRLPLAARGCPRAALTGAALVVPGAPPPPPPRGAPPEHVVLLVMDSLRADRLRLVNPGARADIPVFEGLAAESAVFVQAYQQGNESRVSHASLWTSLYPIRHSMLGPKERLGLQWTTIDEVADRAGLYVAGATGNGYVEPRRWGFGERWKAFANHIHEQKGLKGEDILARGLAFVAKRTDPWFLYLGFIDTHVSWRAKSPWIEQYAPGYEGRFATRFSGEDATAVSTGKITLTDAEIEHVRALYDSNVSYQDQQLGALIDDLRARGIWDRTMLIITADHGDEQWEDGRVGHGGSVRDSLVHVPLIVRYPPLVTPGVVAEGVDVVDVLPTVADALGVPADPEWQGASLIPLAAGDGRGYPRMSFASMFERAHAVRIGAWKARLAGGAAPAIYDLARDPGEQRDLRGTPDAVIAARALLDPAWLFRVHNAEWRKARWGNAANVTAAFAEDLGE